jgi:hypothetical protein
VYDNDDNDDNDDDDDDDHGGMHVACSVCAAVASVGDAGAHARSDDCRHRLTGERVGVRAQMVAHYVSVMDAASGALVDVDRAVVETQMDRVRNDTEMYRWMLLTMSSREGW